MIAHDLRCRQGHQFEAWFKDIATFEAQRRRSLIECPHCGSTRIEMVYRPKAIRSRGTSGGPGRQTAAAGALEKYLRTHFEDVGDRFAEEARRVHYGETAPRNIRGRATADEEKELREEGVGFFRIPSSKTTH